MSSDHPTPPAANGFLVVDKPGGWTSRDVVNRSHRWFPKKTRIGHAGTLDPLATGVLVLCIGPATKFVERVQAMPKTYRTIVRLGATSDTDDADGTVTESPAVCIPTRDEIAPLLTKFIGEIEQQPPAYSALMIDGVRSYARARRGEDFERKPRRVSVTRVELRDYDWPHLDLEIDCGKGTYIRSIARDLGERLGVGGFVQTLRRTRIGPFLAEQGITVDAETTQAWNALRPTGDCFET